MLKLLRDRLTQYSPWGWYFIALVIIVFDQITKSAVTDGFYEGEILPLASFFNLTLRYNTGAAFSMFADQEGWQVWFLGGVAGVVSIAIVVWIARLPKDKWLESLALGLILGGAVGNLYDRIMLRKVVDFIEFHYAGYFFPAFNVADSAITVGAILLIIDAIFFAKQHTVKVE